MSGSGSYEGLFELTMHPLMILNRTNALILDFPRFKEIALRVAMLGVEKGPRTVKKIDTWKTTV